MRLRLAGKQHCYRAALTSLRARAQAILRQTNPARARLGQRSNAHRGRHACGKRGSSVQTLPYHPFAPIAATSHYASGLPDMCLHSVAGKRLPLHYWQRAGVPPIPNKRPKAQAHARWLVAAKRQGWLCLFYAMPAPFLK